MSEALVVLARSDAAAPTAMVANTTDAAVSGNADTAKQLFRPLPCELNLVKLATWTSLAFRTLQCEAIEISDRTATFEMIQ